jgi:hypothetical protein
MNVFQETFLRRYAASPIHVPRLERLLATYGAGGTQEAFAQRFLGWDDACPDGDAARIVTEVLSQVVGADGRLIRLTDDAVHGAIRWLADGGGLDGDFDRSERIATLRSALAELQQA